MAEIVDKYVIETKEAQANLKGVSDELGKVSAQSKKVASQVQTDMVSAARGGAVLTKQYNGLNIAVSQFARELPNAAQSAQIFFMSIGNNFGQLQDAIQRINSQNKELIAQGKPAQSVFKQLAASVFSLSTLLNVGVLVLVLYGKEIGNLISSLFKGGAAIDEAKERFETLNKAFDSKSVLTAVENIDSLRLNIDLARKGIIDKKDVIDQYNKSIGETTGQVQSLTQAEQALNKNAAAYIQLTLLKAAANIANEEAAKAQVEAAKAQLKEQEDLRREAQSRITFNDPESKGLDQFLEQARESSSQKRRTDAQKRIEDLQKIATEFQRQAAEIAANNNFDLFGDRSQDAADQDRRFREIREAALRERKMLQDIADQQISEGLNSGAEKENEAFKERKEQRLKILEDRLKTEKELEGKHAKELQEIVDEAYKELNDAAIKQAEAENNRNKRRVAAEKEVQQKLAELALSTVNNIFDLRSTLEQAATDERIKRLEEEKEKELEVEGLTAEQRKQIEKDFDAQRSAILNKNAETQRKLDLAQILVTTALAVIRQFATGDPLSAPIRAALAATEGAIQYAFASAQPLPKFALGTERVRGGIQGKDSVHALLMPDEAVITSKQNMAHPGLAAAWNAGKLNNFLAMNYIEPALAEIHEKQAARINNTFINQNRNASMSDRRIVNELKENTAVNRLMLKELRNSKLPYKSNRRYWN